MPRMQKRLAEIVASKYQLYHRFPNVAALSTSAYSDAVKKTFQDLDGNFANYSTKIGSYDISTENYDIELDEYLHFNRYRQITMNSPIYTLLQQFPIDLYRAWCKPENENETKCLCTGSHAKRWSTSSSDRQFGISNDPGNLLNHGSSRWKQRAFNDYRKDVLSLVINRPLVRISVYDKIGDYTVEQVLDSSNYIDFAPQVIAFVESRLPSV